MQEFSLIADADLSPWETTARSRRLKVAWRGRALFALSQGPFRAYLYPVFTPAGVQVTVEAPIDHPHHQSVCIGADRVHCALQLPPLTYAPGRVEEATYNFWTDENYGGRAPCRIVSTAIESAEISGDHLRIIQTLEWRGPVQSGTPSGHLVALETRTIDVRPGDDANIIDLRSELEPKQGDLRIGPTLHAYFTMRMADGLRPADGGTLLDSHGRTGAANIRHQNADWVDCSGNAGHDHTAGLAVFPHPSTGLPPWHVSDWGSLQVNPFLVQGRTVRRGEHFDAALRLVAHDGDARQARIADLYQTYRSQKVDSIAPNYVDENR